MTYVWVVKGTLRRRDGATRAYIIGVGSTAPTAELMGWEWMRKEGEKRRSEGVSAGYEVYKFELT